MLPSCRTVFDVGANVGDWAQMAIGINPDIDLHCFEPSEQTFQQLLSRKFPSNVSCNNWGLGSKKENRTLYLDHVYSGSASVFKREGADGLLSDTLLEESVRVDTFENYVDELAITFVDFVKIDVEGCELEAFKGMNSAIKKGQVMTIQFEYGSTYIDARILLKDIWDFVRDTNPAYQFYEIFPFRIQLQEKYSQKFENFLYKNWVIIRN